MGCHLIKALEITGNPISVKFHAGKFLVPGTITARGRSYVLTFAYNKALIEEVKAMAGSKWLGTNGGPKAWSVTKNARNDFQLEYLLGGNPYSPYDAPLEERYFTRTLYKHQKEGAAFLLTRKRCLLAGEMGVGKSLAAIEAAEQSNITDWLWVGPGSALTSVQLEFQKWGFKLQPKIMTYERLRILHEKNALPHCQAVVFDECQKVKNPDAKRTQAAVALTDKIREEDGMIWLLSGSPAPRSPSDWWSLLEIVCPGFIREGTLKKFTQRLSVSAKRETDTGLSYSEHVAWLDNPLKCKVCGQFQDSQGHNQGAANLGIGDAHAFVPSQNEVALLYERLKGAVLVQRKKDCLDLPEKVYRKAVLAPERKTLQLARALVARATTTIEALTLLRELSDGFLYKDEPQGVTKCTACNGSGCVTDYVEGGGAVAVTCWICKGLKEVPRMVRTTQFFNTPKEGALKEDLEAHEDAGRLVVYAGFQGSIDRIVGIVEEAGWDYIRLDGRGWLSSLEGDSLSLLRQFSAIEDSGAESKRIVFVGHPASAGTGLTLVASPTIVYWSNTFDYDSRGQSEDRIHRPGCRGANIVDYLHLETDGLVLDNLLAKRDLQALSLGEIIAALK